MLICLFYLFKNISLTKLTVEIHFPEGRNSLKLGCRQDFQGNNCKFQKYEAQKQIRNYKLKGLGLAKTQELTRFYENLRTKMLLTGQTYEPTHSL